MTVNIGRRDCWSHSAARRPFGRLRRAQQPGMPVVGFATIEPHPIRLCGLPRWLKAHGYESGRNIRIEPRFASL
jgi:hypothetical protein